MSFGAGMAAGMGAGMGSGIAIGIASGKKRACQEVVDYLDAEGITLFGRDGKPLETRAVIEQATRTTCEGKNSKALVLLTILGLVVGAALLVTLAVMMTR